nr:hypothetical protein [uncultured Sphingomonas sp.]
MVDPVRILIQTTIAGAEDDWHIGRFSMLQRFLGGLADAAGAPLYDVVARDRAPAGLPDPVLSKLPQYDFDQLWLFAVDAGDGLEPEDCAGIDAFQRQGGGMLVTRDHMDLGCSVCGLTRIGAAHAFHTHNPIADPAARRADDRGTPAILWPNFHSGANGDFQEIEVQGAPHALLIDPASPTGVIQFLPSHPHEGAVRAPAEDSSSRVIATGTSKATGTTFNIAVVFEPSDSGGPAVAQSTFHHFADFNWDPASGCPSFVTERTGDAMARSSEARRSTRQYVANLARWLGRRAPPAAPA